MDKKKKKSALPEKTSKVKKLWTIIVAVVTFLGLVLGVITKGFQVWDLFSKDKSAKAVPVIDIRIDPFKYNYASHGSYDTGKVTFTIQTSQGSYHIQDDIRIDTLMVLQPDYFYFDDVTQYPTSQVFEVVLDNMILDNRIPEEIGILKFKNNFILKGSKTLDLYYSKKEETIAKLIISIPFKFEDNIIVLKKEIPIIVFNK